MVWSTAVPYTLNYVGWSKMTEYMREISGDVNLPVIIAPVTMHYSLAKSAALLGYGFGSAGCEGSDIAAGQVVSVPVDEYGRADMDDLERTLAYCLEKRIPIVQVIGVAGSTEEGAVDAISEILQKRRKYRERGLDYFVHADSAWGGYMISSMRKPYTFGYGRRQRQENLDLPPYDPAGLFIDKEESPLSDYVYEQFSNICKCDSVTIDPHRN